MRSSLKNNFCQAPRGWVWPEGPKPNLELLEKNCFLRRFHRKVAQPGQFVVPGQLSYPGSCRVLLVPGQLSYPGSCRLGSCRPGSCRPGSCRCIIMSVCTYVSNACNQITRQKPGQTAVPGHTGEWGNKHDLQAPHGDLGDDSNVPDMIKF